MSHERRRERRAVLPGMVSYSFSAHNGYRADDIPAIRINLSDSGMGIIAARPLSEGLSLRVNNNGFAQTSFATVVWCRQEGKFLFKVGLVLN